MFPLLLIISGPTASGKTALSIALAKHFNAEIISADSRQFYRKMDIGTAKVSAEEQAEVKHHFVDFLAPDEDYNAGKFEQDVIPFLENYFHNNSVAILVGGSGLYVNAIKYGFDNVPTTPPGIREKWSAIFENKGIQFLQEELKRLDPIYFEEVDTQNPKRLQRALEAIEISGKTFSELRAKAERKRPFHCIEIQIIPERELLYNQINTRVDSMIEHGLVDEVKNLLDFRSQNALQTVGYREIFDYLDQKYTLDEAIDKVKQHTRNFAKRQITWFKKHRGDIILNNPDSEEAIKQLKRYISV